MSFCVPPVALGRLARGRGGIQPWSGSPVSSALPSGLEPSGLDSVTRGPVIGHGAQPPGRILQGRGVADSPEAWQLSHAIGGRAGTSRAAFPVAKVKEKHMPQVACHHRGNMRAPHGGPPQKVFLGEKGLGARRTSVSLGRPASWFLTP